MALRYQRDEGWRQASARAKSTITNVALSTCVTRPEHFRTVLEFLTCSDGEVTLDKRQIADAKLSVDAGPGVPLAPNAFRFDGRTHRWVAEWQAPLSASDFPRQAKLVVEYTRDRMEGNDKRLIKVEKKVELDRPTQSLETKSSACTIC